MPASAPTTVLHIAQATLATALGDDALTTAAAWAAHRRCFRFHPLEDTKLTVAPATDIVGQAVGAERIQSLLSTALRPLATPLQRDSALPGIQYIMVLPAWLGQPTQAQMAQTLQHSLAAQQPSTSPSRPDVRYWSADTPTACFEALAQRMQALPGTRARTVLLCADSLCERNVVRRDHTAGLVSHTAFEDGWIPGEAAACLVLDAYPNLNHVPAGGIALHLPHGSGPIEPPARGGAQGDGIRLSASVAQALHHAGCTVSHIGQWCHDHDGSRWRTEAHQMMLMRLLQDPGTYYSAVETPLAERLGQLGVATGAVQWALTASLHQHRLSRIDTTLSYALDRSGQCAAAVLSRA